MLAVDSGCCMMNDGPLSSLMSSMVVLVCGVVNDFVLVSENSCGLVFLWSESNEKCKRSPTSIREFVGCVILLQTNHVSELREFSQGASLKSSKAFFCRTYINILHMYVLVNLNNKLFITYNNSTRFY